jgi:CheY-like chemotaxis protein
MAAGKILIVDDDHDIRELLGVRLQAAGYETAFAADAMQAVSAARTEEPRLILLDIGLPGGTGMTVMERLRNFPALAHIPVIAISARETHATEQEAIAAGARAFLSKPIDHELLLDTIGRVLGED